MRNAQTGQQSREQGTGLATGSNKFYRQNFTEQQAVNTFISSSTKSFFS